MGNTIVTVRPGLTRQRLRGLVVVLGTAALLVGSLGVSASPAGAKGTAHPVLFHNSLAKRSKAVHPSAGPGNAWSFVDHKFLGRVLATTDQGGTDYKPNFGGNEFGARNLGNVTIAVDVSLSSKKSSAAGPTCGDARSRDQYVLEISNRGRYTLTFETWNGGDSPSGSLPLTSGSVPTSDTNHLVLKCTQQPRTDGGVQNVSGSVNGTKLKVQRTSDAERFLYNPQMGLHVGAIGPTPATPTTASFSNLEVTQVRAPAKTPLDWSDQSASATNEFLNRSLVVACTGPISTSAPYAGDTHPLFMSEYTSNYKSLLETSATPPSWSRPAFAEDFQLVACLERAPDTVGPTCGTYTRDDGVTGELRRASYDMSVRIVEAATGREIGRTTLTGTFPPCPSESTVAGDPPWTMQGGVGLDQVLQFVTGFTTGPPQ